MLYLDIESRSQCDLIRHGLERYAQDLTTQIICMSYAFDDGEIHDWFAEDEPFPKVVIDYFNSGGLITAHNASFERVMFDYVVSKDHNFTSPKLEQWRCSMARATAHGLPASLKDLGNALNLHLKKQGEGSRLIREYSAPGFRTTWRDGDKELMRVYCNVDTAVMRTICSMLRELTDDEWEQYHITQRINDRGVPLDIEFATAARDYAHAVKADVADQIIRLTNGAVRTATARKDRDAWLLPQLTADQKKLLEVHRKGVMSYSFDKEHRANLMAAGTTTPTVDRFFELLEEAGGSSISKYSAMVNLHVDGKVFHSLIWNGAGATGRYSSKGLQLQNFRRDVSDNAEQLIAQVKNKQQIANPANVLGQLTRAAITTEAGLTYSDYSQIEARVLPWITGSTAGDKYLDVFREGRDLYTENAQDMFQLPNADSVTKDLRQAAKCASLACGFGGGTGAVKAMAKAYGLIFTEDQAAELRTDWRNANQWAVAFWADIKSAAQNAVRTPGQPFQAGRVTLQYDGQFWLWMCLPSGRLIAYAQPRFEEVEYPWGDTGVEITVLWGSGKPKAGQPWLRRTLNHLILCENAVQACAADIMREAIVRAHKADLPILFSVHDELVIEGHREQELHDIMIQPPTWADGLPIAADTETAQRYGK